MNISKFIYSWLKDIVVVFIIISLFDFIMPKGSMKKYVNHTIGIVIIFTIMSPILRFGSLNLNFDKEVFNYKSSNISNYESNLLREHELEIENLYTKKIEEWVKKIVGQMSTYKVEKIELSLDKSEKSYGEITGLNIFITTVDNLDSSKIEVKINSVGNNPIKKDKDEITTMENIKDLISKELGVMKELIYIYNIKN